MRKREPLLPGRQRKQTHFQKAGVCTAALDVRKEESMPRGFVDSSEPPLGPGGIKPFVPKIDLSVIQDVMDAMSAMSTRCRSAGTENDGSSARHAAMVMPTQPAGKRCSSQPARPTSVQRPLRSLQATTSHSDSVRILSGRLGIRSLSSTPSGSIFHQIAQSARDNARRLTSRAEMTRATSTASVEMPLTSDRSTKRMRPQSSRVYRPHEASRPLRPKSAHIANRREFVKEAERIVEREPSSSEEIESDVDDVASSPGTPVEQDEEEQEPPRPLRVAWSSEEPIVVREPRPLVKPARHVEDLPIPRMPDIDDLPFNTRRSELEEQCSAMEQTLHDTIKMREQKQWVRGGNIVGQADAAGTGSGAAEVQGGEVSAAIS